MEGERHSEMKDGRREGLRYERWKEREIER